MTVRISRADAPKLKRLSYQAKIAYETLEEFSDDDLAIICSAQSQPERRGEITLAKIFLKIRRLLQHNRRQEEIERSKLRWQKVALAQTQFRLTWTTAVSWIGLAILVGILAKAFSEREPLLIYAEIINSFSDSPHNIVLAVIVIIGLAAMIFKASSCISLEGDDTFLVFEDQDDLPEQKQLADKQAQKRKAQNDPVQKLIGEFDRAYQSLREKISNKVDERIRQEIIKAAKDGTVSDLIQPCSKSRSYVDEALDTDDS